MSKALAWALRFPQAVSEALRAADLSSAQEGGSEAANFLAEAAETLLQAGNLEGAWELAERGVALKGDLHDAAWAHLRALDLWRLDTADPAYVGIPILTQERREIYELDPTSTSFASTLRSRREVEARVQTLRLQSERQRGDYRIKFNEAAATLFLLGDARKGAELWGAFADDRERAGGIALAAAGCAYAARSFIALGLFEDADRWLARGFPLAARVGGRSNADLQLSAARYERAVMTGDGWQKLFAEVVETALEPEAQDLWAFAATRAAISRGLSWLGQAEPAIDQIAELVAPLELATGSTANYGLMICSAAEALWLLDRREHIATIERNLREKVIEPDFGYINVDGRLSLARICALKGEYEEASDWFAKARTVLDEQGARPLRAIADYDEALMYARRNADGDKERALPLLDAAMQQFRDIDMTGWAQRGEELRASLTA